MSDVVAIKNREHTVLYKDRVIFGKISNRAKCFIKEDEPR